MKTTLTLAVIAFIVCLAIPNANAEQRAPWTNVICFNAITNHWDYLPETLDMGASGGNALLENGRWTLDPQNSDKQIYILENRGWPRMSCSKLRKLCTDAFGRATKRVYPSQKDSRRSTWGRFYEVKSDGTQIECSPPVQTSLTYYFEESKQE